MINIVLGAFFGDEGKGQIVNNLSNEETLVVRFSGGPQCGHTVHYDGMKHTFSNFGSGTLKGAHTYWSEYCPVNLMAMTAEKEKLRGLGISPVIMYSPHCQLITPWDIAYQQSNSTNLRHGTVGVGFGSTLQRVKAGYSLKLVECQSSPSIIEEKLHSIANYYPNIQNFDISGIAKLYFQLAKGLELINFSDVKRYMNYVFEGSQGILLDQNYGFMPFCTPSNTTGENAYKLITEGRLPITCYNGWASNIDVHIVTRPYITRHGNGPLMVPEITVENPMEINKENQYQGKLRTGMLDVSLLRHSLKIEKAIKGPRRCYHIDVTCADLIPNLQFMDYGEYYPCKVLASKIENLIEKDVNFYSFGDKITV